MLNMRNDCIQRDRSRESGVSYCHYDSSLKDDKTETQRLNKPLKVIKPISGTNRIQFMLLP